jgi:hypothetical protein
VERISIPATVTPAVAAFDVHLPMLRRYLQTLGARSDRVGALRGVCGVGKSRPAVPAPGIVGSIIAAEGQQGR